jgi:RNA polymerase sigma-70 factor (ECF subfamily)
MDMQAEISQEAFSDSESEKKTPQRDLASLLLRHGGALRRYIMIFLPRADDIEEVLQRTAISIWERFDQYDPERSFLAWASHLAYYEVLSYRKEFARCRLIFEEELLEDLVRAQEAEEVVLDGQIVALRECMRGLDRESLDLLNRRYCLSETVGQMSLEIGRTAKSIYRRLDRLRERLYLCVERRLLAEGMDQEKVAN